MRKAAMVVLILAASCGTAAAEVRHTVVQDEHLWALAKRYYKNPLLWRAIHEANRDKIKDPHWIFPGQVLVIPESAASEPAETAAAATAPASSPSAPPAAKALPAPPKTPEPQPQETALAEDLMTRMPPSAVTFGADRLKAPKGWKEDGRITVFEGREVMAAQGDVVNGKIAANAAVAVGDTLVVYRADAPREMDDDPKGSYLQKVGLVEVKEKVGKSEYRLLILKSGDSLQLDDLLKKEAP